MTTENKSIYRDDLQNIIQRIIKQVEEMGFTQIQLCHEAGLKRDNLSKMKNPTLKTLIKFLEAKKRLEKKIKGS